MAQAVVEHGQEAPAALSGLALIDTGASSTCIDEQAAQRLGPPVIDVVSIASVSHPSSPSGAYPVTLEIVGLPMPLSVPRAIGAQLSPQGISALIGRDALQFCALFYDGPAGQTALSVQPATSVATSPRPRCPPGGRRGEKTCRR